MFTGAPGVLASAHLLAAIDAPGGMLEYGIGPNPARDVLLDRIVEKGTFALGHAPGLGLDVDVRRLAPHLTAL
jgi:L-alanine-DL-glutamate epimerase-like enolase superfamily enzyme